MAKLFLSEELQHQENVVSLSKNFLLINLIGQLFDTVRVAMTAGLRAYSDTFSPMLINLLTNMFINVPLSMLAILLFDWPVESVLGARNFTILIGSVLLLAKFLFRSNEKKCPAPEFIVASPV